MSEQPKMPPEIWGHGYDWDECIVDGATRYTRTDLVAEKIEVAFKVAYSMGAERVRGETSHEAWEQYATYKAKQGGGE